jgi:hypothetical protein
MLSYSIVNTVLQTIDNKQKNARLQYNIPNPKVLSIDLGRGMGHTTASKYLAKYFCKLQKKVLFIGRKFNDFDSPYFTVKSFGECEQIHNLLGFNPNVIIIDNYSNFPQHIEIPFNLEQEWVIRLG